jgi:hypothetical protein
MMKYLVVLALALVSGCATPSVSNDTRHWRYVNESTDDRTMWSSAPSDPPQPSHHGDICRSDSPDRSAYFQALHEHNLTRVEAIVARWGCHVYDYVQMEGLQANVAEACRMDEELCRAACRGINLHRGHLHVYQCN